MGDGNRMPEREACLLPAPADKGSVTSTTVAPTDASFAVRAWRAPLGAHAAALALVLLALVPWLGSSRLFSADEGALQAQAHVLADGEDWFIDHPRPDVDPDGRSFLLHLSTPGEDASAPFAKHPVYATVLAPLEGIGGKTAMVLTSLAGTVLAALAAACLARRIRPGTERWALWAVGIASPAFLYGYVLIAHTLGAALVGGAVVLATADRVGRRQAAGIAAAMALAVTLRTEALLFGVALAAACAAVAVAHRQRHRFAVAGSAMAGAVGGYALDHALAAIVAGQQGILNPTASGSSGNLVSDRVFAAVLTWLLPSYDGLGADDLLLAATAILGVAAVVVARRRPEDAGGLRFLGGLAAACAVARLLLPAGMTPGLLIAFPLLAAGIVAFRPQRLKDDPATAVAAVTFALFCLAVLATQYRDGGSGEWGGRYFLLGLPVAVPLAVAALSDVGRTVDASTRRFLLASAVTASLALAVTSGLALYDKQWLAQHGTDALEATAAAHPDAVVVVTDGNAGRRAWPHAVAGDEWFLADGDEALEHLSGTFAAEHRDLVVSTLDEDAALAVLAPRYELVERVDPDAGPDRVVLALTPR